MTSKAALCKALLEGRVVNIKNGVELFGITNIPREIGRSVERAFGVVVSRVQMEGSSRYGQPCVWVNYRLNQIEANTEGIQKMKDYVSEQLGIAPTSQKTTPASKLIATAENHQKEKDKRIEYREQDLFGSEK